MATAAATTLGLHQVADVALPGGSSRLDYQSLDQVNHRLYIAHLGASRVTVVDTQSQAVVGSLPNVADVHGVLAVPQLGRVYASATGKNQVSVVDTSSLTVVATTAAGDYPDGLAYDPDDAKIFVSDEHGGTDTVVSTATNQRTGTIDVGGDVGNTVYDQPSRRVYVAVGARNQLIAIDPTQDRVAAQYDLPGCQHAHGLLIDEASRQAFIACDANATLVVFDLTTMTEMATQTVGSDPDVLAFDTGLHRLYVAAESGVVAVFEEQGTRLTKLGQALLADHAHTIAVDQATHRVYLPLENVGGKPVLRIMEPGPRSGSTTQGGQP
jgi:YVTN family beta-propeller protein